MMAKMADKTLLLACRSLASFTAAYFALAVADDYILPLSSASSVKADIYTAKARPER